MLGGYTVLCSYVIFFITMRVRLRGRYNLPRTGPYIIAANHLSWLDIPFVPAFVPRKVIFMAKEELFHGKVGWLVRFLGAFPVKRGEGDRQAIRAADEQLKQQKVFMIFPEGTRSKDMHYGQGQSGVGHDCITRRCTSCACRNLGQRKWTKKIWRTRLQSPMVNPSS